MQLAPSPPWCASVLRTTFLENCVLGDLVVTSIAERNRLASEALVNTDKV